MRLMCNEKQHDEEEYRFMDYRLDQLEKNLERGIQKIEQEQRRNNTEVMKTLQTMQEGINDTTRTLIVHEGKLNSIEEKSKCLETLKKETTKQAQQIKTLYSRMATYRQILMGVGVTAVAAIIVEVIKFI